MVLQESTFTLPIKSLEKTKRLRLMQLRVYGKEKGLAVGVEVVVVVVTQPTQTRTKAEMQAKKRTSGTQTSIWTTEAP